MDRPDARHAQARPVPRAHVGWGIAGVVLAILVAAPFVVRIFGGA